MITGFMGTGKSCVGALLAQRFGIAFADLDLKIEQTEGISVSDIFRAKGERYFRKLENQLFETLILSEKPMVIATGGGTLCTLENLKLAKANGIIITLTAQMETIIERLAGKRDRPLFKPGPSGEEEMAALYHRRWEFYQQGDLLVATDHKTLEAVEQELAALLFKSGFPLGKQLA